MIDMTGTIVYASSNITTLLGPHLVSVCTHLVAGLVF